MPESDRDIKKILDDLKDQLQKDPKTPYDETDVFQELKDKIEEENRASGERTEAALKEETQVLKDSADSNKAMNIAQIAKEVFTFRRERAADKASTDSFQRIEKNQKVADENTKKQIKHNRGAKDAREIMLEQNKIQLENDKATAAQLEEIQNTNQNILNILQQTVEGPEGAQKGDLKKGSDGHVYEYEGAQWVDQKTGKMATRQMAQELNVNPTTTSAPKATAGTGPQVVKVEVANTEELSQATKDVETEERRASQPESRRGQRAQPTAETTRPLTEAEIKALADKTTRGGEQLNERSKRSGFGMSDEDYARQRQRDEASMERIAKRKDIQNKSAEVSTNKDSLNLDKIAQDELDTGSQRLAQGETLRVKGRHGEAVNYFRYKEGYGGKDKDPSEQTAKFGGRDDDGKWLGFQDTDPIRELAEDINISQGVVGTTMNRTQHSVSKASASMFKAIGESGSAVQKALEENPQAREDFDKLTKLMQKVQTGEGNDKDVAALQTQIERLKMTGGEDLAKNLNLDQVQKDTKGGGLLSGAMSKIKTDFFGINMGTSLRDEEGNLSVGSAWKGVKQGFGEAFSADRWLGRAGTGRASNIRSLQGENQFVENARRELEEESQDEAQRRYESNTYLVDEQKPETGSSKKEEWREKWIPEGSEATAMPAQPEQAAAVQEQTTETQAQTAAGNKADKPNKREKMVAKRTGISKDQDKLATEETLKKVLERLEEMADNAGGGGGGGFGGFFGGGGGKNKGGKKGGKGGKLSRLKGLAGRGMGLMGRVAAPLAVGAALYEGYTGYQEADQLVESGAINPETGELYTQQDETAGKTEAVTKAAGGAGGALAGAAAGAAIGSVIPVVGTAIGGIVGGALGYFAGGAVGEGVGDALTTTSGEVALDAAQDSGLYDKDLMGNSEINPEILAQTTDTAQLQAIISDNDLSNEDMKLVQDRLAEVQAGPIASAETQPTTSAEAIPTPKEDTGASGALAGTAGGTAKAYTVSGEAYPVMPGEEVDKRASNNLLMGAKNRAKFDPSFSVDPDWEWQKETPIGMAGAAGSGILKKEEGFLGKLFGGDSVGDALTTGLAAAVPGGLIAKSILGGDEKRDGLLAQAGEFLGFGSAEKAVLPTADAVSNMTRLGNEADQVANAPVVVNNTTKESAPQRDPNDKLLGVMTEPTVRLAGTSSLNRAQDRRYLG